MGFLVRVFLLTVIIYFFIKLVRNFFAPRQQTQSKVGRNSHQEVSPPPYDPNAVEDIDYKEVRKNNNDD